MSETKMRAARIVGPEKFEIESVSKPEPTSDQIRFRVEGCGVCASNLGPWFGLPWTKYPLAPGESGHEAWGVVDAVGDGARGFAIGDRVAALSYNAYAEFDLADANSTLRIPASLGDLPLPAEPFGCAFNIFARAQIQRGDLVAIVGVGFLGAVLTRLAVAAGARVIAISRRPFSLDLARAMGAEQTLPLDDHQALIASVTAYTSGGMCDVVIEATGKQWPLDLSAELVATRGRLVIAGYHQDGPRQVNMQLWNWKGIDVINAHEREAQAYLSGMRAAVDALGAQKLDPKPLLSHRYALDRLGDALAATHDRPHGFVKALVLP
ncbi:MAG TPA: zinc-binding dehydrogenase [Polyangiaceae bacterium]|jgi:threonine dehydrogenase-like Zn-dependent dehydrogenase|nr:zinc-binding dehydrogenase [Polyangiaceae bacterium]